MLFHGSFISDGADSYCMVPKTKGASRHMHLISEKHLMEELRRLNLRRRSWVQKALVWGKRTRRRVLLKNMPQCCHSSYHERERCTTEIVLVMDYPRAVLRLSVTRERVDEGRLPKERTKSKLEETLQCGGRDHKWRDHNSSSFHKDQKAMEMSPGGDMVQRIVVEQFVAMRYTRVESREGLYHTEGERLVMNGAKKVENAEANSKYQDKAEGQRLRNFIRPVSTSFSSR
ncbi:hypothetical protein C4D60_Mb10t20730 [Musa balbisiana]|uniref:Uncharacterized protein n=1 Tax=Musa balbisiana TaxID=52838 RepID=A0A4S8J138_MUSBA|nr:hypothetical protein C4D60_Mb10t20730 [Musa balbisiana]